MTSNLRRLLPLVLAPALLILIASPAWSQVAQGGVVKEGGFVGLSFVPQFAFDGVTFDGQSGYIEEDGDEIMLLPRVDQRKMFRGILGYRYRQASLEVSYERTNHVGSFLDEIPLKATFQAVNVDGRLFFAPNSRVQPHVLIGGSYPMLTIEDGSILHNAVGNARFNGYGVNTEAGVTVYPHRQLGISVGYAYRALWFDRVKGVSDTQFHLKPKFKETSGSFLLTAQFIL